MKKLKLKILKMLRNFCLARQNVYEHYADVLDDEIIKISSLDSEIVPTKMKQFYDTVTLDFAKIENELFPVPHNLKGNKIEWRKYNKLEIPNKSLHEQWREKQNDI